MPKARVQYLAYQVALALPAALCAVAVAQTVPDGRPIARLLSVGVVVVAWLIASSRLKSWFFGAHLRQRLREGYFDELAGLYRPAYELAGAGAARVRMALILAICDLERDRAESALAWLDRVPEAQIDQTTRAMLLAQRARALADRGEDALVIAERALELSRGGPNEVAALTARGVVHLRGGRGAAAAADLEEASRLAAAAGPEVPYLAAARARFLGEAYRALGDVDRARAAFARAAAFPRRIPAARHAAAALAELAAA